MAKAMTKSKIIAAVAEKAGISKKQTALVLETLAQMAYKEAKNGQILEEGITEAGSLSSFIAAGTAYATHGVNTIPFFIFYSMFGFQRIGDLLWAAGDMRCRGFLLGATAGRTTLAGEGLQHQDGNSHVLALPHPTVRAYDPEGMVQARRLMDVETCDDAYDTMKDADVLVLLTEWNEFRALNLVKVGELLKQKLIVDLRNIYASAQMQAYGFAYVSIGRPAVRPAPALAVAAE